MITRMCFCTEPSSRTLRREDKGGGDPDRIEHFMTTFRPDIILLDMNFSRDAISGQEGFDSLKQILSIDPQAVVIFMTAYADTDKAVRAIKAGATDFIPAVEKENCWRPFLRA